MAVVPWVVQEGSFTDSTRYSLTFFEDDVTRLLHRVEYTNGSVDRSCFLSVLPSGATDWIDLGPLLPNRTDAKNISPNLRPSLAGVSIQFGPL